MHANDADDFASLPPLLKAVSNGKFTPFEVAAYYRARVPDLSQRGTGEWRGRCPIHRGTRDSFAVNPETGNWFCHSQCGRGGSIFDFEMELSGVQFREAASNIEILL